MAQWACASGSGWQLGLRSAFHPSPVLRSPPRRFQPDMMGLAVFAWTWVTTAGPAWLLPLASRAAAAWSITIGEQGLAPLTLSRSAAQTTPCCLQARVAHLR